MASKTSEAAQTKFFELTEEIRKFRKKYNYDKDILEIRNDTIGHIENDPVRFFDRISKFEEDKAFAALEEFVSILVSMLNLSDYIFINYTKKVIADSSFQLAAMNKYSVEINRLLDLLDSQTIGEARNSS